jgi:hypothetical protein
VAYEACSVCLECGSSLRVSQQMLGVRFHTCVLHGCGQGVSGRSSSLVWLCATAASSGLDLLFGT